MSGGHYNYAYIKTDQFAESLSDDLANPIERSGLPEDVIAKLRTISALASYTAKLMKEAEWLFSNDTGPETFMRRVAEIEKSRP
jgi:hypothetical protein